MSVRIFPIRHHGPGSARALRRSLAAWRPDAVLVEGPPEAEAVLGLAAHPEMRPPVALLGYMPGRPEHYSFYPLASWSPEWVAIRHALTAGAAIRMIDLPVAAFLEAPGSRPPGDPISDLATAAGYDDPERWWEDVVEHRLEGEPWDAVTEAMAVLREQVETVDEFEARREASMRQHIRVVERAYQRVAVVCGAWHAPALTDRGPARPDAELLRGLPRRRAVVTWVPWTNSRLSFASGYGAGVTSPGWYGHLFQSPDRPVERWMVRVARLLRTEHLDAPPASVIDAVRLAETLATLRGRPLAGLGECTDAARAALAGGHDEALALIERRLVVGDDLGQVPPETPVVPLAADLAASQKRLRLRPEARVRHLDLDLRRDIDLQRSHLLHRLDTLNVPWGVRLADPRGTGTFREEWSLVWDPELSVRVIEASVHGTTVEEAAAGAVAEQATGSGRLAVVTGLVEVCLLADLPVALPSVLAALDARAASTGDVGEMIEAVVPLARVARYGSVRRSDTEAVARVLDALVVRAASGLVPAAAGLDEEAAAAMASRIDEATASLSILGARTKGLWLAALERLSVAGSSAPLLRGRTTRLLLDAARIGSAEAGRRLSAALSPGTEVTESASWVEGFVSGSGLLLVHDPELLGLIDAWLTETPHFEAVLPLMRRSFSGFQPGERRLIAEAAAALRRPEGPRTQIPADHHGVDEERAAEALPLLSRLLGP